MSDNTFDQVTLLITHYNRSNSLGLLLGDVVKEGLKFHDIVVSDDGSRPEHLDIVKELQQKYNFTLVTTPVNKGLGNNLNKGQDAVKSEYTLYVQEDFEPTPDFVPNFRNAVKLMNEEHQWDIIRFYTFPWAPFPYLKDYKLGFAEMIFRPQLWHTDHLKFRVYSDHPHIRRANFFEKFGRYDEGIKGDITEYNMCLRFLRAKGRALIYNRGELFTHRHDEVEPSTMVRSAWKLSNSAFIRFLRYVYLKGKVINSTYKLRFKK
ncbi:glycosyltransferase family 2 protein [Mucilaginibacter ginkgonis]|uniref:Glycosyltransferase family 2 protein n=1 Tax=Mucilaginibacter ginkgonis TaxID=2682091 RepID=A0A6I4HVP9_9SPHI|nr:glycosyltransferase family 2 protein [Mucilaginibacter ginkgonis]QQL51015.1 glycosyltransferase family 2 protein [Mucilaginibacter ginkgonis]